MTLKIIETIIILGCILLGGYVGYKEERKMSLGALFGAICGAGVGVFLALTTHMIWS